MLRFKSSGWIGVGLLSVGIGFAGVALLARADDSANKSDAALWQKTVDRGVDFLINKGQLEDGSFGKGMGPGVAAICTTALIRSGRTANDPAVAKGLKYIETFRQKDGGYYSPNRGLQNYETSIVAVCFAAAGDGYKKQMKEAEDYLRKIQFGPGGDNKAEPSDVNYGGSGYGHEKRPDLSNTQFFLDALQAAGAGADDPAVKRALVFVSRCQNLESEHNTTGIAAKNPDGGFYYTPSDDGASAAGTTANGGLISYGSMTYAGLKSMIFAGLTKDDPRVKAAVDWIQKNYTLDENPGMPKSEAGLYYYYHTFAIALNALGQDEIVDAKGEKHNWRHDLIDALAKRQKEDGSWVNSIPRWFEGDPNLVTAYALLSLSYAKPKN